MGTNNRPVSSAYEANRKFNKKDLYYYNYYSTDDKNKHREQFMQDMYNQLLCKETFKILMLIFEAMRENPDINETNYEDFIKNLNIARIINTKKVLNAKFDNFEEIYKLMFNYLYDHMKDDIKIYQYGTKGKKDFYYKFVIDKYMEFINYKSVKDPNPRQNWQLIQIIDYSTVKPNTKAIFYVYPYRERWGAVNLQFIIIDTADDNKELYNKWFRFHYNDKKDKYSGPRPEVYTKDLMDMAYGMTVFRDTNITFPTDPEFEINSLEDSSNKTVQELGEEEPPANVEEPTANVEEVELLPTSEGEPDIVGNEFGYMTLGENNVGEPDTPQELYHENPPTFAEEEPPASGGRRRRKTRKSRKRSKKTKKGRRRKSV